MDQGVDSKALVTTLIMKIPILLVFAVTGALVGSGLNLIISSVKEKSAKYVLESQYYINFGDGLFESSQYYNAYTWNDIIGYDEILGRAMESLGEGYDRTQIRSEITASIPSDVRYLTITVKGNTPDYVANVGNAIGESLIEFADTKDEFVSIYKVNEGEIELEAIPHFTVRAALLGAFILFAIALFVICFNFILGSSFYTKRDVLRALDIPVKGIELKNGEYEGIIEKPVEKYNDMFYLDKDSDNTVIAIIPFGKSCREKMIDEIDTLKIKGINVSGAIMVGVNKLWYKMYRA